MADIWRRDWPGILATSFTVALFCACITMVIDNRYAWHEVNERSRNVESQVLQNRQELLANRKLIDDLHRELAAWKAKPGPP